MAELYSIYVKYEKKIIVEYSNTSSRPVYVWGFQMVLKRGRGEGPQSAVVVTNIRRGIVVGR